VVAPNTAWSGDITYIATDEGWLYFAVVIDLFSRQVVGWSMRPDIGAAGYEFAHFAIQPFIH
jgi:putative transposase